MTLISGTQIIHYGLHDFKVEIQTDICARPTFSRFRENSNLENGNIL